LNESGSELLLEKYIEQHQDKYLAIAGATVINRKKWKEYTTFALQAHFSSSSSSTTTPTTSTGNNYFYDNSILTTNYTNTKESNKISDSSYETFCTNYSFYLSDFFTCTNHNNIMISNNTALPIKSIPTCEYSAHLYYDFMSYCLTGLLDNNSQHHHDTVNQERILPSSSSSSSSSISSSISSSSSSSK
jgi:hypothetical protein